MFSKNLEGRKEEKKEWKQNILKTFGGKEGRKKQFLSSFLSFFLFPFGIKKKQREERKEKSIFYQFWKKEKKTGRTEAKKEGGRQVCKNRLFQKNLAG